MITAEAGDRIDMGDGRIGIIVEARAGGTFLVSWNGGARTTVAPDGRAHIDRGYWARMVESTEAAEARERAAARSDAARRGWATRRAAEVRSLPVPGT